MHWRLPNLAEAEFGRIWEKWPNFGLAEAEIRCNPSYWDVTQTAHNQSQLGRKGGREGRRRDLAYPKILACPHGLTQLAHECFRFACQQPAQNTLRFIFHQYSGYAYDTVHFDGIYCLFSIIDLFHFFPIHSLQNLTRNNVQRTEDSGL